MFLTQLTRKQHGELFFLWKPKKEIRAKEFFTHPLKIRRNPLVADEVLGSMVQTHLNSSAPVLKHWHFVGANKHRWIWVWLPAVSASPSYSHSFPSSTVLFVFFLLSEPFTSWDIRKLTAQLFHCTGPVPKHLAEEKKLSLSTEELPLSSRKLSEVCGHSLYC